MLHGYVPGYWKAASGLEREGSVVKTTGRSSRGPSFYSLHLDSSLQLSLTPVPGDLMISFGLSKPQAHMWHIDIHAGKTTIHIK